MTNTRHASLLWIGSKHVIYNSKNHYFPLVMSYPSVVSSNTLSRGNMVIFVLINSKRRVDLKDIKTDNVWLMHVDCLERILGEQQ